jgi:GlcNAc-P-P-Und epimerase
MSAGRKILVTGGSGFVGTNLVDYFIREGKDVCNFDILPPRNSQHFPYWKTVDIRNKKELIDGVASFQPDIILHCAARTDLGEAQNLDGYSANIDGVCHLIDAIRIAGTVDRAIFFSSQLVCQLGYTPVGIEDYHPSTLYGQSKVLGEKSVRNADAFCPTWMIVRPTSLWGPWFDIPYKQLFNTIRRGFYVHPQGVHTLKQWGFIGNTVYQVQRLLDAPQRLVHGMTFYMADYEPVELRVFTDQIQVALGAHPIRSIPPNLLRGMGKIGDAMQRLGWRNPPLTSFRVYNIISDELQDVNPLQLVAGALPYTVDQGIQETANWLRSN